MAGSPVYLQACESLRVCESASQPAFKGKVTAGLPIVVLSQAPESAEKEALGHVVGSGLAEWWWWRRRGGGGGEAAEKSRHKYQGIARRLLGTGIAGLFSPGRTCTLSLLFGPLVLANGLFTSHSAIASKPFSAGSITSKVVWLSHFSGLDSTESQHSAA